MSSLRLPLIFLLLLVVAWQRSDGVPSVDARQRAVDAVVDFLQKRLKEKRADESEEDEEDEDDESDDESDDEGSSESDEKGQTGEVEKRSMLSPAQRSFETPVLTTSKITKQQSREILNLHRKERQLAKASNMLAITWDDELARLAQGLADGCVFVHDNLKLPSGEKVGQNIAAWSDPNASIKSLVDLWINEKNDYDVSTHTCSAVCGHYTQMVWSTSTKVGCGLSKCSSLGAFLVCDYSPSGNWIGETPFELGPACSTCNLYPGTSCNQGMCSPCKPRKNKKDCKKYDSSKCFDAKVDPKITDCELYKEYCSMRDYEPWMKENCSKTCKFCHS